MAFWYLGRGRGGSPVLKIRRKALLFPCFLLVNALIACTSTPPPPPSVTPEPAAAVLPIGLTTAALPLADLVAAPYAQVTDQVVLQFVPANTETLFADLMDEQVAAILVHHIPRQHTVWFNPVALDGLVIVTHPENPVQDLSRGEVQAIFNGRLSNWADVGGFDQPIQLISREPGAGTRSLFLERVMAEQRISINARLQPDNQAVLAQAAAEETAVGYAMMASAEAVNAVAIEGHSPTPAEMGSQQYPLMTPLYFVSLAEPEGELRAFLAWLQSVEGQVILGEKYGRVR